MTKFELSGTFLASPQPIFAFWLQNKQPLQMALVVIGPRRADHNPKTYEQARFELSGRFLASPRPILTSWLLNIQPLQMDLHFCF